MKEITGNLWDFYQKPLHTICLTTNGFVKKNGEAVMGRGNASEAVQRIPGIQRELGRYIKINGNRAGFLYADFFDGGIDSSIYIFPVKHNWFDQADLKLIKQSAEELGCTARMMPNQTFVLPRPGCGNGWLKWKDVEPLLVGTLPYNVEVIDFPKGGSNVEIR